MVVSPVKDKCPKENPDNCKYVYFPYHIERSGSQLETCRVVNGVESIRSGIHRRPSAPIKASKARSIFVTMSNPHTYRPPLTLSITDQKALFKFSQAGVIFGFTRSFVYPSSRATIELVSVAVINTLTPRIRLHPASILS